MRIAFFLMILFALTSASKAQEFEDALFTSLPPEDRDWVEKTIKESLEKDKTLNQVDYVRLRSGGMLEKSLRAGLSGLPIRPVILHLPKLPPVTIVTDHVFQQSQGFIAWNGHIQGETDSLVSVVVGESDPARGKVIALYGTIVVGGRKFQISPAEKDSYVIAEIKTSKFPPEGPPRISKPKPLPVQPHSPFVVPKGNGEEIKRTLLAPFINSCRIDVLVAYTSLAKQEAEPAGCTLCSIDAEIQDAIDEANMTYLNSGLKMWLNPINELGVNYETCVTENGNRTCYMETGSTTGDLATDLDNLLSANPAGPTPPLPGQSNYPLTIVHQWRNALGADLVALWVKGPQTAGGQPAGDCGRSTQMWEDPDFPGTFPDDPAVPFSEQAFAVVSRKCAKGQYSMAHEFGHLGAAHHDRGYEGSEYPGVGGVPDTLYSYGYAHPSSTSTDNWRTIMTENLKAGMTCPTGAQCCKDCDRVPQWSNPDKSYLGSATGIRDNFPPPPLTSSPVLESSANNSQTLSKSAQTVAGFRPPKVSAGTCEGIVLSADPFPPPPPNNLRVQ